MIDRRIITLVVGGVCLGLMLGALLLPVRHGTSSTTTTAGVTGQYVVAGSSIHGCGPPLFDRTNSVLDMIENPDGSTTIITEKCGDVAKSRFALAGLLAAAGGVLLRRGLRMPDAAEEAELVSPR
jgi:hypothetical protein